MSASELVAGTVFSGYLISARLGSGGMGTVYRARHPRLPRTVALKVLNPKVSADRVFRARFEREADIVARLDHPNIVDVYDRGDEDGVLWVSMRYMPDGDAAGLIRRHPRGLDPAAAVRIVTAVAAGLDYAHAQGVVHRDVKPANIFLGDDRVLVGDFGIARSTDPSATMTQGPSPLTLAYAAPEQRAGQAADRRADVYALGVTLHELLTGRLPGVDANRPLPARLHQVVTRATATDPAARYPTCAALAAAAAGAAGPDRSAGLVVGTLALTAAFLATAWALAGPKTLTPQPRSIVDIVRIPGDRDLHCPVPYLKSDRGPVGLCTEFEPTGKSATHGKYYPATGIWEPSGTFDLVDRKYHIDAQPDGRVYAGAGFIVTALTGPIGLGHLYASDHDTGQFTRTGLRGFLPDSPFLPVCPPNPRDC
ncbi:serine/threonine-protein kinase [Nocardia sp. NPDC050712]|uniref:serine/threonine-protein kinase n=1 Tax=Nocardia sp. NPDC050712 TaxID=3155518 RepID=UPI0033D483F9